MKLPDPGGKQAAKDELVKILLKEMGRDCLTPEEGEVLAKERGIGPLQRFPSLSEANPLNETSWTIEMVLAWIMWRDIKVVREFWPKYCDATLKLRSNLGIPLATDDAAYTLEPQEPLHLGCMKVFTEDWLQKVIRFGSDGRAAPQHVIVPYDRAEKMFLSACALEDIKAQGLKTDTDIRGPIQKENWLAAKLEDLCMRDPGSQIHAILKTGPEEHGYTEILFPSKIVLDLWPGDDCRKSHANKSEGEIQKSSSESGNVIKLPVRNAKPKVAGGLPMNDSNETFVDPNDYDPLSEPTLSFMMLLAWLMTRDVNSVREFWDEYCEAKGMDRTPGLDAMYDEDFPIMGREKAQKLVASACLNSELQAFGVSSRSMKPEEIPAHFWGISEIAFDSPNMQPYLINEPALESAPKYSKIKFPTKQVLELWPSAEEQPKADLVLLEKPVSTAPKSKRGPKAADYWNDMKIECFRILDECGIPNTPGSSLANLKDLSGKLLNWFEENYPEQKVPSGTRLDELRKKWIDEYESGISDN